MGASRFCFSSFHLHSSLLVLFGLQMLIPLAARQAVPTHAGSLAKWREMRFGLFIHWGPVSLAVTEIGWSRGREVPEATYDQLYQRFNPTQFDADEWARIARNAGMKYLVITSKHHDGFALWDSKVTDYDIMATPFGRDVIRELSDACRKYGLEFSTYHSICDWYHPDYPFGSPGWKSAKSNPNMNRYVQFLRAQIREIIEGYGPLGIMWFDGEWEEPWTHEYGLDLYLYVRSLQPDILINNRVDKGREGMRGITISDEFAGDYDTPEQEVGNFNRKRPWETCMTIGKQWAWKAGDELKSPAECLRNLLQVAGGDGNFLFNVGPMPDGRIEPRQTDRLLAMGNWLQRYGEGVYGTRGGPYQPGDWGASTCKGSEIYVYIWNWGENGKLYLPPLGTAITKHKVLSDSSVSITRSEQGLVVSSERRSGEIATVVKLTVQGEAFEIEPLVVSQFP